MSTSPAENTRIRIDKWLWAARFFKTRSLATEAINGGKVHVNRQRIKPSREVHIGDQLTIRISHTERTVIVQGLSRHRGPATVAVLLYEETAESIEKREKAASLNRQQSLEKALRPRGAGRPTKRDRRQLHQFKHQDDTEG